MAPVKRLVMLGPAPGTRDGAASLVETYRAQGLFARWPVDYLATYGDAGVVADVRLVAKALRRFLSLLAREPGLVVHLHAASGRGLWREALFAALARALQRPYLLHLHGGAFSRLHDEGGALARGALRLLLEQAACVVVPCESLRAWTRSVARSAQVTVLRPAVPAAEPPAPAPRPSVVLFIGRIETGKGVFDLLEAVAGLRPVVPDVRLVCAGQGEGAALARRAEELGIADAVKLTGWVGPSGRRALLENASVFALPSYDEGLPMSLLEAMAAGVPAVVSPVGGIPEIVVDGASGLFAAPGDVATLQRQLRKLLLDRALSARIGAAARESVRIRCAPERTLAGLGALYGELGVPALGPPPGQSPAHGSTLAH